MRGGAWEFAAMAAARLVWFGQARAVAPQRAVTTVARSAVAPELQTLAEAGTPAAVIAPWNNALVQALQYPDVTARFAADGAIPVGHAAEAFGAYVRRELVKWTRVVKVPGATVQ